ncbi:hypothetical protein [Crocosphaera chwakensis]|uniref:Uncharacterized protein n=1 Tax=Crocosphaera chwakensis CCY0110 TaxID=391612 RepID=A3IR16_9CHRO|nr:hypothetical protein [Crocosphaera chwakensis]EAZ91006.1 hypothetical protein CY0110_27380 [Crocosphaera chwakensis CCY0110]
MKININFSNQKLVRLESSFYNISFGINWECEKIYYPDQNWSDLGIAVLGCWIGTVQELIKGKNEAEFIFLDGPYFLAAKYNKKSGILQLTPEGLDIKCQIKLSDFIDKLIIAIEQVHQELKQRNIREKEQMSLEKGINILKDSLKQLEF